MKSLNTNYKKHLTWNSIYFIEVSVNIPAPWERPWERYSTRPKPCSLGKILNKAKHSHTQTGYVIRTITMTVMVLTVVVMNSKNLYQYLRNFQDLGEILNCII